MAACTLADRGTTPIRFDADNPAWTGEDFARARPARHMLPARVVAAFGKKRGRPVAKVKKEQVTARLDPAILAAPRTGGPGWQSRLNDVLKKALGV